jgi:hypothetical protein
MENSDASDLFDADTFMVNENVRLLVNDEHYRADDWRRSLIVLKKPEHGRFLPLFTDEHLAKQLRFDIGLPGKAIMTLRWTVLRTILSEFRNAGMEYVGFDVSAKPTLRGRFYAVQEIIDAIPGATDGLA